MDAWGRARHVAGGVLNDHAQTCAAAAAAA